MRSDRPIALANTGQTDCLAASITLSGTANAFSSDSVPMSTARLYTMSLPGRSLWGAGAGDPFNPKCLDAPDAAGGVGLVCGGVITFGGGVPLYRNQTRVGGLGLSGDTPCADHEIAKRIRQLEEKMYQLARDLEFEQAAQVRDQIRRLKDAMLAGWCLRTP